MLLVVRFRLMGDSGHKYVNTIQLIIPRLRSFADYITMYSRLLMCTLEVH